MRFQLAMVPGGTSVQDAIAETIDSDKSGLLVQRPQGDLRLVHFKNLVNAAASGLTSLDDVEAEPVLDVVTIPDAEHKVAVRSSGRRFGFGGERDGTADLLSISESFALPYTTASTGVRCQRPNKPPTIPPRDWYHYYPPNTRDPVSPNQCRLCGANVP